MDKISIVVPVYNVEKYLRKCVQSIVNQTYKNIEVILVNDGSTDASGRICNELEKDYACVRVIHKENGGLSSARNIGIDVACGEYIGFVDSDDFIDSTMYERLYSAIKSSNCDLAICGVQMISGHMEKIETPRVVDGIVDKFFLIERSLENEGWIYVTAWNRLYKKEVFKHLRFEKGKYNEDMFLAPHLFERCSRGVTISDALYFYVQRKGSIMHSRLNIKALDQVEAYYNAYKMIEEKKYDNNLVKKAAKQTCYVFGFRRWRVHPQSDVEKNYIKRIESEFAETFKVVQENKFYCKFCSDHPLLYSVLFMIIFKFQNFVEKLKL